MECVQYWSGTGVKFSASPAPDGNEVRAWFLASEDIAPLPCVLEDGKSQAVVAMHVVLRDLYTETTPRSDL